MNNSYIKYAAIYNFTYMSIGALLPLIGQYLKYIGFTGAEIGTVTAAGTAVAIFASTFWGKIYNRSNKKHEILTLLCVMAALVCFGLSNIKEYYLFIFAFGIMYFFQAPIMPLTDAFVVENMHKFGVLRAWGAVGFALGIFLAGIAADAINISVIFWFYIGSYLLAAFVILSIRNNGESKQNSYESKRNLTGYKILLKDKWIRRLILCAFFMGGTNVANNTYFGFLYLDAGGSVTGLGFVMLLMVGSEVPFMAWCEKLSAKFTMEKMIFFAMITSVLRFLVYGIGLPWWMLMVLSFSQGAVNGILLVEFVRYVSALAPKGSESLAISAYYIIGSNISTICCQVAGGIILDKMGAHAVYTFFGLFNLIGVLLYIKFKLYKKVKKGIDNAKGI